MKNILKYAILALLGSFLFACGDGDNVPKQYLGKDKMSGILRDMAIADAYSNDQMLTNYHNYSDSIRQNILKVYYKQILDLHHVSVQEFMTSYKYYESHPNRLKEVLQMVQGDLDTRKEKLGTLYEENAPVRLRIKNMFPYADSVILLPKSDTAIPFIKRNP